MLVQRVTRFFCLFHRCVDVIFPFYGVNVCPFDQMSPSSFPMEIPPGTVEESIPPS